MTERIKMKDRVGQKFGRLTITSVFRDGKRSYAECDCSCGNRLTSRIDALQSGATVSCGCYNKYITSKTHKTHGMQDTGSYHSWEAMKQRCFNKNHGGYGTYKDVPVCEKWLNFVGFYEDMGDRPENATLDRIDGEDGYHKGNCRWVSASIQAKNQKKRNLGGTYSDFKGVCKDKRAKSTDGWMFSVTKNYRTVRKYCQSEEQAAAYFNYCTKLLYEEEVQLNNVGYILTEQEKQMLIQITANKFPDIVNKGVNNAQK